MNKPSRKQLNVKDLIVDFNLNIRDRNNYGLDKMDEDILRVGRIEKPLEIDGDTGKVLRGNRRTLSAQRLLERADLPTDVRHALTHVECLIYTNLTDRERVQLVNDHGAEKDIARCELVEAIWRLDKQMFSEAEIISIMYFALAQYTGKRTKIIEIDKIKDSAARATALKKWLHGTVGNYLLAIAKMGEMVRRQFILTEKVLDGLITEEEKKEIKFKVTRERVQKLSQAKTADAKTPEGWTVDQGGVSFNKCIEEFIKEDSGTVEKQKNSRPSVKTLKDKADVFKSRSTRLALLAAAGEQPEGLVESDEESFRLEKVRDVLLEAIARVPTGPQSVDLNALLSRIAVGTPGQVNEFLSELYPVS